MSSSDSHSFPFDTVLIANRGEIAIRFIHALHSLGLRAAAVFVSDDSTSPHVRLADVAHNLGSSHTLYNDIPSMLSAARAVNAGAVLPGYGFLSENPDAAAAFQRDHIVWLGPTAQTIHLFGLKHTARAAAVAAGVPVVPGSDVLDNVQTAKQEATRIGYPLLFKATAGGGGMGQAVAHDPHQVQRAFESVTKQAQTLFGSSQVFAERFVEHARHVEVQVFGDGKGNVVALGDRDCTLQRRRQKVLEEAPAPELPASARKGLHEAAVALCKSVEYRSAGTVEFIVDARDPTQWYFLEVNTRLQVEHGVTEMVCGVDIVRAMVCLGAGVDVFNCNTNQLPLTSKDVRCDGACVEARVYAENPVKDYAPSAGTVLALEWPEEEAVRRDVGDDAIRLRVDAWGERGVHVLPHYDPMLGKILAWAPTRALAIATLHAALQRTLVRGVACNVQLLQQALSNEKFANATHTTRTLGTMTPRAREVEVITPGLQSSLQDYPGRIGYWHIGVSPSGPMDAYAMGMGNALVGNARNASALEIAVAGPTLKFHTDAIIALTGAQLPATLDEAGDGTQTVRVAYWTPIYIPAGAVLAIGTAGKSGGKTAYLSVRYGFDAPLYLGSASTFPTGKFGGVTGSFLAAGDMLPIGTMTSTSNDLFQRAEHAGLMLRWPVGKTLDARFIPDYAVAEDVWEVAALNGPHASTDFLHDDTLRELWTHAYEVHHATNRLGARLIGPVPKWTRADGGSAGLHPSNLHDYTYAPGAVNLSGNTPIVLMLDGPSLGGFVCPITIASADLWKVAQASPGQSVRFRPVDFDAAKHAMKYMSGAWDAVRRCDTASLDEIAKTWSPWWVKEKACSEKEAPSAILARLEREKDDVEVDVVYRMSGDEHVLVEYGAPELDLAYRFRVHLLTEALQGRDFVQELCPGVRSLLVRYDRDMIHVRDLTSVLTSLECGGALGLVRDVSVPSRVIELPLAFEDQWTVEAQARYLRSVRPDAPYMPSNVEFMRRINGLKTVDDVRDVMTSAEYMVLGLGDVYLGAPCAVPVDPRHRMVTSKYNPARTYTPEGAVGIGGAYMCIYGMDSPGGYQLAGRTLPIWDNYGSVPESQRGKPRHVPWLLRFFDRVKFFLVSDDELQHLREQYRNGDYTIRITQDNFSCRDYDQFLTDNADSIHAFEQRRKAAYDEERARWEAQGEGASDAAARHAAANNGAARKPDDNGEDTAGESGSENPNGPKEDSTIIVPVRAGMSANVWSVCVQKDDKVENGDELVTLESMKVEMSIRSPIAATVQSIEVHKGDSVRPDDIIVKLAVSQEEDDGESGGEVNVKKIAEFTIAEMRRRVELGLTDTQREVQRCVVRARRMGIQVEENTTIGSAGIIGKEENIVDDGNAWLQDVPFIADDTTPLPILDAVKSAGAIQVGRAPARKAVAAGAGVFGIALDDVEGAALQSGDMGQVEDGCMTLRVSNGLLPVLDNEEQDGQWKMTKAVCIVAHSGADMAAVLRACKEARRLTIHDHLLVQTATVQQGEEDEKAIIVAVTSKENETRVQQAGFDTTVLDVQFLDDVTEEKAERRRREAEAKLWKVADVIVCSDETTKSNVEKGGGGAGLVLVKCWKGSSCVGLNEGWCVTENGQIGSDFY